MKPIIKVIIPAYNEQDSIANVINDIPKTVDEIIVISNNSTDNTEINAKNAGATVLSETRKGYGYACLKGMEYIENQANVWPKVLDELKKINVKNYSIILKEDFMFGYLEYDGDSFDKDMAQMQNIPIVEKWTKLMIDCFNPFPNNENNNSWVMMDQIFFME